MMADRLAPLPYYKWFWQRWRANRNVQRMRLADRGAYRELIDECWAEGFIPDDVSALAEICGCEVEEMAEVWPHIRARFYEIQPGRYTNHALEDQRTELDTLRVVNSKNARDAALARVKAANAERVLAHPGDSLGERHIEEERKEEERKESIAQSAKKPALQAPKLLLPDQVAGTLPLVDGTDYQVSKAQVFEWGEAFPAVDVTQQLRVMKEWVKANPNKRKTRKGVAKFIVSWLTKEQDKPHIGQSGGSLTPAPRKVDLLLEQFLKERQASNAR